MTDDSDDGVEKEDLGDDSQSPISEPYDPTKVDIVSMQLSVHSILDRVRNAEIDFDTDFQRNPLLWNKKEQSLLIESILIRVPLPIFYFDGRDDNCWGIVDGLQRISTLNNFVLREKEDPNKLTLSGLEYLCDYNGKTFEELPRPMQRRINESQILCYCIRAGTPSDVAISIFKRINTGGLTLNPAEIRNAVYRGQAANLVKDMADCNEFTVATQGSVNPKRMQDKDLATRFLAFYIRGVEQYKGRMLTFLEKAMDIVQNKYTPGECKAVLSTFKGTMQFCADLFGGNAFRRKDSLSGKYGPINKALFECISVCAAKLSDSDRVKLVENKERALSTYRKIFDESFFTKAGTATGDVAKVRLRHKNASDFFEYALDACK